MSQTIAKRRRFNVRNYQARTQQRRNHSRRLRLENLEPRLALSGTWTALAHAAPAGIGTMELLSDGTVIGTQGKNWYKLTPDSTGSYVNGTWSTMASMSLERLYDATNVLPDGRVFVLGGEYSGPSLAANWTNTGEIYNPVTNTWSSIPNFPQANFGDDPSDAACPTAGCWWASLSGPQTYIYDPANSSWSNGPTKLYGDRSDEETWTKLARRQHPVVRHLGQPAACAADGSRDDDLDRCRQRAGSRFGQRLGNRSGRSASRWARVSEWAPPATRRSTRRRRRPAAREPGRPVRSFPADWASNDAPAAMMPNGHVLFAAGTIPGWQRARRISSNSIRPPRSLLR